MAEQQRQDEEKQLQAMRERTQREEQKALRDCNVRAQAELARKSVLGRQVEQRNARSCREKEEDVLYAAGVSRNVRAQEEVEREKVRKQREDMARYKETLERQMEDTRRKKLFKDVMSEHERRVNGLELDAYEKMDLRLHTKLVGAKDVDEVCSAFPSPAKPCETASKPADNYELVKKINMVDSVLRRKERAFQSEPRQGTSSRIVRQALQNMLDPRVVYMRNNTHNRVYGYEGESFHRSDTNQSLHLLNSVLGNEGQARTSRNNPLTNAGMSQIVSAAPMNVSPHKSQQIHPNPPRAAGTLQDVFSRRQAPIRKRYANYNIITGSESMYT